MHVRLLVFIFLLGAHLNASGNSGYSFSNNNPDQESRFEQRQLYKQLIYLIKTNQRSKYRAKQSQLIDYPLYPYLEYTEKANRISRQSESAISDFVEQYQDTPLANRLLQRWLSSLARRGEWEKLVANYLQEGATDANNCHYAYALHKNDKRDEAIALARKLWLVKFSQPDACDPIFKVWRDSEGLTNDLVWARFSMALTANNVTLATYLMRFIDKKDKALANSFKLAHTKPRYITQTNRFKRKDDKTQSAILHGLKRLARKDAMKALNTLNIYLDSHEFSQEQLDPVLTYIGVRIARDPDTVDALDQIPFDLSKDQQILEAKLRTSLRQLDWRDVLVYIHLLEDEVQQSDRWQYWKARILSASDDSKDQQIATGIYRSLARQRSFYGFMSADVLKVEYNFQDNPISISEEEILALEETPGIERALELFILNERTNARREWNFTTRDFSSRELQIAARVAKKWGWHEQAIQAMIAAEAWNDLDIRFPLAFQDNFISGARTADIPLDWNIAVARQESAFMPDARSPVGALGIMQLMPETAKLTARRVGMNSPSVRDLTNPSTNIRLGSAYLGQMLRRFKHNRILASAAYNAGPARVKTWIDDKLPLDVWVETIPFRETRSYVMNVLVFSTIYSRKLDRSSPLIYEHELRSFSRQQITSSSTGSPDKS